MTVVDRERREAVLRAEALRFQRRARRPGARRDAVLRAALALRLAASTTPGGLDRA